MKKEILTVIILTYNSSRTIKKCLDSLVSQTNNNFDVLIVDDNSTDNTLSIIKSNKYLLKISILVNGTHNISVGRNIGIKNSSNKFIAFLDSDAYADKNWVKNIIFHFKKDKSIAVIGGLEIPIFSNNFSKGNSLNDLAIKRLSSNFWVIKGCNVAVNKANLANQTFNENFTHNEESEFIERLNKMGKKFCLDKEIKVKHETRNTPRKYMSQMYRYGLWRIYFSFYSKKYRFIDFYPSILVLLTLLLAFFTLYSLLIIPLFSVLETLFVIIYMKAKIEYVPSIFLGWFIKNVGWGFGTIAGLLKILFDNELIHNLESN